MDWHCHAMSVLGVHKLDSFLSNRPVDEAAAFIIPCCVCGYPCIPTHVALDSICWRDRHNHQGHG